MSSVILGTVSVFYIFALFVMLFRRLRGPRSDVPKSLYAVWAIIFIGQGQMFTIDGTATMSVGGIYQLSWMILGGFIALLILAKYKINLPSNFTPLFALFLYFFAGILSAMVSPKPLLSTYKSMQIFMDILVMVGTLSVLRDKKDYDNIYNLIIFLTTLILLSAALSGFLIPHIVFKDITGAYTGVLKCWYPRLHWNELGLLAGVVAIVGFRRLSDPESSKNKLYWLGTFILAATVLFYSQARTSLASTALAIFAMMMVFPRLRLLVIPSVIVGLLGLVMYLFGDSLFVFSGSTLETYLKRGGSEEDIMSLSGRLYLWQIGWKMFLDSPFIGHGFDAGVRFGASEYGMEFGVNMHNAHIQILATTGLMGYLSWLFFVIPTCLRPLRALRIFKVSTVIGRQQFEMLCILFLIVFRTFAGHVLVTHHFSFIIFFSIFVSGTLRLARK